MRGVIVSLFLNLAIVCFLVLMHILYHREKGKEIFSADYVLWLRFFTNLSNLFCGFSALLLAIAEVRVLFFGGEGIPAALIIMKFAGTTAVAVTFFTVLFFLGPTQGGHKQFYLQEGFVMHFVNPVLAMISFMALEGRFLPLRTAAGIVPAAGQFGALLIFAGWLPVPLYAVFYLYNVVKKQGQDDAWPDFYGFNQGGNWRIYMTAMFIAALIVSFVTAFVSGAI